jgi:Activator of Hsp90 ATPase homolog 1-like protein.
MEKKIFQTSINASKEKVWKTLWNHDTYKLWTAVFAEGSTVETDNWKEGSKVLFLDGKGNGMVSKVAANRPNEFMSFKHLGVIKDGKEDMGNEKNNEWSGATENYTLNGQNGKTELIVEMDITEEYRDYFEKTWPKALEKLKELAEKQ